jgi:hypothetical protein
MSDDAAWWEDTNTDWGQGDPARAVDLFARSYPDDEQLRRVVEEIQLPWSGSAGSPAERWLAVFEAAVKAERHGPLELAAYLLFEPGPDQAAFREPLIRLLGSRLAQAHNLGVIRYGRHAARATTSVAKESLEAIVSRSAGFDDAEAYSRALEDHRLRTAQLRRGNLDAGTGVLIGPDLLLTAAHVLRYNGWPPAMPLGMHAIFDRDSSRGRSMAAAGIRVDITELVFGLPPTAAERQGTAVAGAEAPLTHLDFAVVRLARPIGRERRGFYPVDATEYSFGRPLRIVHHPVGALAMISNVTGSVTRTGNQSRLDYTTNTLPGSSGCPIVDDAGYLVGIHHAGPEGRSRGVPFSTISRVLLDGPHAGLFTPQEPPHRPSPFVATMLAGDPFVDRAPLRDTLQSMADRNGRRHLAIAGEAELGKSHSFMFLTHVAGNSQSCAELLAHAAGGMRAIVVDLDSYAGLPAAEQLPEVGQFLLLESADPRTAPDETAQRPRHAITIANRLRGAIRNSDQQWWICFDSIDYPEQLKQSGMHELINAVVGLTRDLQLQVRVVLGGQRVREFLDDPATNLRWFAHEFEAVPISAAHAAEWVQLRADEEGRQLRPGDLEAHLADFLATELQLTPEKMADFQRDGWPPRDVADALPAFLAHVSREAS